MKTTHFKRKYPIPRFGQPVKRFCDDHTIGPAAKAAGPMVILPSKARLLWRQERLQAAYLLLRAVSAGLVVRGRKRDSGV